MKTDLYSTSLFHIDDKSLSISITLGIREFHRITKPIGDDCFSHFACLLWSVFLSHVIIINNLVISTCVYDYSAHFTLLVLYLG